MAETRETSFGRMLTLAWGGDPEAVELLTFQAEGRDHTHDRWEHAVCLSGPCEIIVDGEEQPAPVGAVFSVPPDTPHRMRPTTDEPSHWLLWYSDGPATLSTPREPEVDSLEYRIGIQNGSAGTLEEGEEAERHAHKVTWNDCHFGAPVEIRFRWTDGDNGDEWSEHGYLTTLPEYSEPDMDGVIHLPEVMGEKQAGGPIWITVSDAAALPDVAEVIIGGTDPSPSPYTDEDGREGEGDGDE